MTDSLTTGATDAGADPVEMCTGINPEPSLLTLVFVS